MGFFSIFGVKKAENILDDIKTHMIKFDPETAKEVELEMLEKKLDDVNMQLTEAINIMKKEENDVVNITKLYYQKIRAVEILNSKGNIESAEKLMNEVEEMSISVDQEKQEYEEAKQYVNNLQEEVRYGADKLKTARKRIEDAKRNMDRANLELKKAERNEERNKILAGLHTPSNIDTVLNTLNKETEIIKNKADSMNRKAELLKPHKLEEDNEIAKALKEAEGIKTSQSIAERLAALKK